MEEEAMCQRQASKNKTHIFLFVGKSHNAAHAFRTKEIKFAVFSVWLTWDGGGGARATVLHGPKEIKVQKSGTSTSLKFSDHVGRQPYRR